MSAEQFIEMLGEHNLVIVVSIFAILALAEMVMPLTKNRGSVKFRWFTNLSIVLLIMLIFKFSGPVIAVAAAMVAQYLNVGLFNNISLTLPLVLVLGIALLDFKQYLFHRMMHYFDTLWRVHRVHHSDIEVDLTTGFRFHPFEIILSGLVDIIVVAVFGIAAEVILLRYILVSFINFFSHSDLLIPPTLDRCLKWVLVTPSMHHLHHALDSRASNQNFGVLFSFWDRIFRTYLSEHPQSKQGTDDKGIVYGIEDYREPSMLNLGLLMWMPFKSVPISANKS